METYLLIVIICLSCFLCAMILRQIDLIHKQLDSIENSIHYLETQNDLNLKELNAVSSRLNEVHSDVEALAVGYNALVKDNQENGHT